MNDPIQTFTVVMQSRQYGEETFTGYESLGEAYKALARIAQSCADQKDEIHRQFNICGHWSRANATDET